MVNQFLTDGRGDDDRRRRLFPVAAAGLTWFRRINAPLESATGLGLVLARLEQGGHVGLGEVQGVGLDVVGDGGHRQGQVIAAGGIGGGGVGGGEEGDLY